MNDNILIINIAVPINNNTLFRYSAPDECTKEDVLYRRVLVNFNNRIIQGFAVSCGEYTDQYKIKPIIKIIDKRVLIDKRMIDFAKWIADYYFAGIGEVLSLMVPKCKSAKKEEVFEEKINQENITLTEYQEHIYKNIACEINKGEKRFYLYGITGSGKTEIYIKLIEDAIKQNKDCILLVPEIALSYQTLYKLKNKFGNLCAMLHSGLKSSTRLKEYLRLFDGDAKIAIGPRSALFAPLKNLGLIIIDEENEGSYKSEENPRFHARTCAQYLAKMNNAVLLLGSATPSIESWYYAINNYFKLYKMNQRYAGAELPSIEIIDNSKTKMIKNLSIELIDQINKKLKNREQVILLQNRRGFANFIKCKNCDYTFGCPKCNILLTYHKSKNKLTCHHCGYSADFQAICPKCKDSKLLKIGAGTQRIEDEIQEIFKHAKILRIDLDSLKKIKNLNEIFHKIGKGDIDILIGTQMIAKGLHFPKVKLVGIINADLILNLPDYKASERAFSLITQVAGRAGRVGEKGHVIIQTFNKDHYAIINAKRCDFESFYSAEINFRKLLKMPPFYRMIRLVIRGIEEEKVKNDMNILIKIINNKNIENIIVMGPAPCMLEKINNNYRHQILLKSKNISKIQKLLNESINEVKIYHKNYLEIDVDPIDLL
ncbi:MAG: primosomal protein N' [Spirochaetes bacterium]|nr:primosomal protein N' [Spirochaetota bacterium]